MTLGQRIQKGRKEAGLSQEELAEQLGVSRQAVSRWEERFLQYIMEHQKKNVMLRCGVLVITMGMVGRFLMISQKIVFGSAE